MADEDRARAGALVGETWARPDELEGRRSKLVEEKSAAEAAR